jgi:hypothetical protein
MPSYLETQMEDALRKAKGNQTKARALLMEKITEDERLLRALTKPHLQAIVAHGVSHYAAQFKRQKQNDDDAVSKAAKTAKGKTGVEAGFGLDLLKALGGANVPKFGKEDAAPPIRRKEASQSHVNALKIIASKSKTKK